MVNESNEHFFDYLLSDFARMVLSKNKMKTYLDTGNICYNNLNMRESIYSFMCAQQNGTKNLSILIEILLMILSFTWMK